MCLPDSHTIIYLQPEVYVIFIAESCQIIIQKNSTCYEKGATPSNLLSHPHSYGYITQLNMKVLWVHHVFGFTSCHLSQEEDGARARVCARRYAGAGENGNIRDDNVCYVMHEDCK